MITSFQPPLAITLMVQEAFPLNPLAHRSRWTCSFRFKGAEVL